MRAGACVALLLLVAGRGLAQVGAADAKSVGFKETPSVKVYMRVDDKTAEVTFVGRTE